MATVNTKLKGAPLAHQEPQEIALLIEALEHAQSKKRRGGFSVKRTTFNVETDRQVVKLDSWRMQDWDYKRRDLPIYARGLFTTKNSRTQGPEIAVRGYDKFFNVDEVHETKWENIMSRTTPPYEITLKENGCIVFVAGLEDETLLVCSKHSTGGRSDSQLSHSSAAEARLERQLRAIGKTKAELARELRNRNATAVAELCDDEFEEHILAYTPDKAGLYLHGMNLNIPKFTTYPSHLVQEFGNIWGFKNTDLIVMNSFNEVRAFLEDAAQSGTHDGRDVEGFVIRCKMSHDPTKVPYQDWFFKYKFEEPYLMYRQWRECTKALIAGRQPKFKKHITITEQYLLYARKRLAADPKLGQLYNQNHGIIALRDDFLRFKEINGADAANFDNNDPLVMPDITKDIVLCPLATIGCGKTTVALALADIFGWGHVQNDNISGKGRPPRFVAAIFDQLKVHPVVFADRNNAQRHERKQILTDIKLRHKSAKVVCLNFRHDENVLDEIRSVTRERVLERGDNHQTIRAASDQDKFMGIMEGFIERFEPCQPHSRPDDGFDVVIDLDPVAGSRKNLETTVTELYRYFPNLFKEVPGPDKLDAAIQQALGYKPLFRHEIPDRGVKGKEKQRKQPEPQKTRKAQLEYMSLDVSAQGVHEVLEKAFANSDSNVSRFYMQLKQTRRIQRSFHVTLMHRATSKQFPDVWQKYVYLLEEATNAGRSQLGECDVVLERVVFDDRIMAIVVRLVDQDGAWPCVNQVAHITVGTRDDRVKPKESNDLLHRWLEDGVSNGANIREIVFANKPSIKGQVKGVLSR